MIVTATFGEVSSRFCSNVPINGLQSLLFVCLSIFSHFREGLTGKTLMMCDDAFSSICHAINDMDVSVRAEAAALLGQFDNVSDEFLEQTLDKKLMRTLKVLHFITFKERKVLDNRCCEI